MTTAPDVQRTTPNTAPRRVWVGDRLLEAEEATVAATDHGLVAGGGVFESLKVTGRGAFAVTRHLQRLSRSAAALGLPEPDHALVRTAVEAVVEGRDYDLGIVRVTWTGGVGPLGSGRAFGPPTLVVADAPAAWPPEETAVVTVPWTRNEHGAMTGVKTTSYGENVRGLAYAVERDASEGIFCNTAGHVCEGTGSNLFVVVDGEVVTSPLSSGALAGVTRALVLEWAEVSERDLTLAEAQAADEVFLTSSLRDVQRVTRWDDHRYSADGPVTGRLRRLFAERSESDWDPR
ncbi:4-amino-4-deoxychorismate lyase [Auraticoccus sp. F435]|uniref:4-amino-4-deoxychorismate lyase n=1 Tax=Auraticoccus cholistanensis TaxID=2656650 RepID=A0A6A9V0K6_9ACTN|nr:aminotransferase class IV [Auraticoccus cholistanensis]MVA75779.1 4-amino-4-deoxychorismate lyase [Auraticoccus cholistanensis]